MARRYYMLYTRDDGVWSPQFGDYSRKVVEGEREDYRDHDCKAKDLKVVRLDSDLQADIDAMTIKLNSGE